MRMRMCECLPFMLASSVPSSSPFFGDNTRLPQVIQLSTASADAAPNIGVPAANYAMRAACAVAFAGVIERPGRALIVCTDKEVPLYETIRSAKCSMYGRNACLLFSFLLCFGSPLLAAPCEDAHRRGEGGEKPTRREERDGNDARGA